MKSAQQQFIELAAEQGKFTYEEFRTTSRVGTRLTGFGFKQIKEAYAATLRAGVEVFNNVVVVSESKTEMLVEGTDFALRGVIGLCEERHKVVLSTEHPNRLLILK